MHEEYISNYTTSNQTYSLQTFQDNHEFNWEPMKLVCYYNFPTPGYELKPENIDPYLCTHINVGILHIVNSSVPITEEKKEVWYVTSNKSWTLLFNWLTHTDVYIHIYTHTLRHNFIIYFRLLNKLSIWSLAIPN